jgi:DNA-binding NarL/FixJ family response regulator
MSIRIVIADDHAVVAEGLRALIDAQDDMEVVGLAENGHEAVRQCLELHPSLIVMDLAMPELDGIEATRVVRKRCPGVRVVVLSMHGTGAHVRRALSAGADGYVLKGSIGRELLEAIRTVEAGRRYLSKPLADEMLDSLVFNSAEDPLSLLSVRESQVLKLIAEGHSSAAIGLKLSLSRKTVETYRSRMMEKLGIDDLAGLIKFAIQRGLVPLD